MQIPYHLHPARQGAHLALSNSLRDKVSVRILNGVSGEEEVRFPMELGELIVHVFTLLTDCYLRQGAHPAWQGAGGTEFARNASRTCFLR